MSHENVTSLYLKSHSIQGHAHHEEYVLELDVDTNIEYLQVFVRLDVGLFPPRCDSHGLRRVGLDIYSVCICVCCLLLCCVGAQPASSQFGYPSVTSGSCPQACKCSLLSTTQTSVNISCVNSNLKNVPDFSNMEISVLNLSGNFLNNIWNHSFERMKFLQVLNLAHNHIAFINSGTFHGLSQLTHLYLNNNNLSTLTKDTFVDLPSLRHLDLSHNQLRTLPAGLFIIPDYPAPGEAIRQTGKRSVNVNLEYLDVSHNEDLGGSLVPEMFPFTKLRHFGLADTGLSDPNIVVSFLARNTTDALQHLDLSNNRFTGLFAKHLDVFNEKVSTLNLSGNPFNCDCSIFSMVHWLQKNKNYVMHKWILPTCHQPDNLRNISVMNLTSDQVKVNCDLKAKCRNMEQFVSDKTFDMDDCTTTVESFVTDLSSTSPTLSSTAFVSYDNIRSTYDPRIGWYTALALGGMVFLLIISLVVEKFKKRYENYRYRLWKRNILKAMDDAKQAEMSSQDDPDIASPLQSMDQYSYTNEVNMSDSKDIGDVCNNINSRRVSISWGPTSDIAKPEKSASTLSVHSKPPKVARSESLAERKPTLSHQSPRQIESSHSTATDRRPPQTLAISSGATYLPSSRTGSSSSVRPGYSRSSSTTSSRPPMSRASSIASSRPMSRQSSESSQSSRQPMPRQSSQTSDRLTPSTAAGCKSARHPMSKQSSQTSDRLTAAVASSGTTRHPMSRGSSTTSSRPPMSRQSSTASTRPPMSRQTSTASTRRPMSRSSSTATDRVAANHSGRPSISRSHSTAVNSSTTSSGSERLSPSTARANTSRTSLHRSGETAKQRRASFAQSASSNRSSPKTPRLVTPIVTVDSDRSSVAMVHSTKTDKEKTRHSSNNPGTVQSLWNTLDAVIRDLKVAELHPDCPLHNKKSYKRLKARIEKNPGASVARLLAKYDK